jgi:hypothetical protein
MKPQVSLPHSREPATCLFWATSNQSMPPPIPRLKIHFNIIPHLRLCHHTPCTEPHVPFPLFRSYQRISPGSRRKYPFRNVIRSYGEELLATRPAPKLEYHRLAAVFNCLFNIFAATLRIEGRSSIRSLRMRHAVVTGIQLSWPSQLKHYKYTHSLLFPIK